MWGRRGDQSVTACGLSVMLKWPVFSLGSQHKVIHLYSLVQLQSLLLLFLTGAVAISDSRYGAGDPDDSIFAGGLTCDGSETSLLQCTSTGPAGCTHAQDAGLECQPSMCVCVCMHAEQIGRM